MTKAKGAATRGDSDRTSGRVKSGRSPVGGRVSGSTSGGKTSAATHQVAGGKGRLSASVDVELLAIAQAAVDEGRAPSVSAWVNDALHRQAEYEKRLAALRSFISDYETEQGEITEAEMAAAERAMAGRAIVVR